MKPATLLLAPLPLYALPTWLAWLSHPDDDDDNTTTTLPPQPHRDAVSFPHRPGSLSAGFVALGDSYSAGIGTGLNGSAQVDCRLGVHAYPLLIRDDLVMASNATNTTTSFQHLSCTGSTVDDVLAGGSRSQIDLFNTTASADFALLSIGGNDLGFFDIMNSCIFRFFSLVSGTCEAALARSDAQIAGPEFEQRLRLLIMEILDRVHWEKRPWFTITVTGYARFFNDDTRECDDYSLGVWWRGPKLTQELRTRMNLMVTQVNRRIKQAIDAINEAFTEPRVLFVDYDDAFDGHRFCEPGVVEPDYMRNETWFFLVGGEDNDGTVMPHDPLPPDQYKDVEAAWEKGQQLVAQNSMWYVPTYYGKTFHPRTKGHMAIRDRIYQTWREMDLWARTSEEL